MLKDCVGPLDIGASEILTSKARYLGVDISKGGLVKASKLEKSIPYAPR